MNDAQKRAQRRAQSTAHCLKKIRATRPLVHNITNYVVMNWTANCLLAIGASPVMAHAEEEVEDMVCLAQALVINIGTLDTPWIQSMRKAIDAAKKHQIPVILDPVGAGATRYRTETTIGFLESQSISVLRGNASEILALSGASSRSRGVDSVERSDAAVEGAVHLSQKYECVVCVSGEIDFVVQNQTIREIRGGHPLMTRVTGMGCASTALIGAFARISSSVFDATVHAMSVIGVAGELAARDSVGPGSFQAHFLDHLYRLDEATITSHLRAAP